MSYRVFISCVSNEFVGVREVLAADLDTIDIQPEWQGNLRPDAHGDTVLRRLRKKIKDCDAVICLQGAQSGWFPPEPTTREFRRLLPRNVDRASATQWEYLFAKRLHKRTYVYRPGPQLAATANPPAAADDPVAQQQFNDMVEHEHGHSFENVRDLAELRVKVLQIDWRMNEEARLVVMLRRIRAFVILLLFANLVSYASNAGTLADLAPILFIGPASKPMFQYYVDGDGTHGFVVAMADKLSHVTMRIPGRDEPVALGKVPGFDVWTWTAASSTDPRIEIAFGERSPSSADSWAVEFGPTGRCTDGETRCYELAKPGEHKIARPIENWGGPRDADFGRASLSSRYDELVAQSNMIAILGTIGFSALIAVMAGEIARFGRSLAGAAKWRAHPAIE